MCAVVDLPLLIYMLKLILYAVFNFNIVRSKLIFSKYYLPTKLFIEKFMPCTYYAYIEHINTGHCKFIVVVKPERKIIIF